MKKTVKYYCKLYIRYILFIPSRSTIIIRGKPMNHPAGFHIKWYIEGSLTCALTHEQWWRPGQALCPHWWYSFGTCCTSHWWGRTLLREQFQTLRKHSWSFLMSKCYAPFAYYFFFFWRKTLKVYRSQSSLNRWLELNTLFLFKDTFSWVLQSSNNFLKEACYLEAQLNATETRQALFSYIALHSRCLGNNLQRA